MFICGAWLGGISRIWGSAKILKSVGYSLAGNHDQAAGEVSQREDLLREGADYERANHRYTEKCLQILGIWGQFNDELYFLGKIKLRCELKLQDDNKVLLFVLSIVIEKNYHK
jgi:hypothetical protein